MIKKFLFAYFCLVCVVIHPRMVEKAITIDIVEEWVNKIQYIHRIDMIDGSKKETWSINGKTVSAQEYEDSILQAEMEENRKKRKKEHEEQEKELALKWDLKTMGGKKLLELSLKDVEVELKKIDDNKLNNFLVFGANSLASYEELMDLKNKIIPDTNNMLNLSSDKINLQDLNKQIALLEPYKDLLKNTFAATVKNAIGRCDDTKMLKELLELI
ncbi:MAG: hypothetical protein UR26_C0005G0011 [candidate division TM6 bacterium GW2011_GWF2_32_72]|nr:MAG: hypothetical protein UR26_C0005G0011 [candidate division TM6 bacterium GW2011_GWF2_32_72]